MTTMRATHQAERILRREERELLNAWRDLVQANAEQARRLSEVDDGDDPWGAGYAGSTVDLENPHPACAYFAALLRPEDRLLDIGSGFGGTMLPVAGRVRSVIALDPSPGMIAKLKENIRLNGITNVDVLEPLAWPPDEPLEQHDVCLASAVVYEIAEIGPFLDAMERHAQRLCIALVAEWGTGFIPYDPLFTELHGEPYIRPPAFRDFIDLLCARRRRFDVQTLPISWPAEDLEAAMADRGRKNFLLREGSEKEARLRRMLAEHHAAGDDRVQLPHPAGNFLGIVSWEPPGA
jgi:hypothetical protein